MCDYIIYTDGAYKPTRQQGGYSVVFCDNMYNILDMKFKGVKNTTNNRMEIAGLLAALELIPSDKSALIVSDSEYVIKTCTLGWLEKWKAEDWKDKKNIDLWRRVDELLPTKNVSFKWVKGHSSDRLNIIADMLAQHAAEIEIYEN